jgi:hypothetical protein
MTIIFRRMFPNCSFPSVLRILLAPIVAASALLSPDISLRTLHSAEPTPMKIGIIGLDTSHATAFAKEFNGTNPARECVGMKVVAAYPQGSKDIESSTSRVPAYTEEVKQLGVNIVGSIDELLKQVDCVLLESNDGRPHLEQVLPVFKAGKRVFIDKPVAGSLADCIAIYKASEKYKVPTFCSSSLRWMAGANELRGGKLGKVLGCDTYGPCHLEPTHPDLFWYGIHGCEALFTVMGENCESVTRTSTPGYELVVGKWNDGRLGSFRGIHAGASGYGGTVFAEKGIENLGGYGGYRPLVVEIARYFKTGEVPVSPNETIALYAFMEAADESKRQKGAEVKIADVLKQAEEAAAKRLAELDK